jgi:uncharacterized protein YkwD
MQSMNRTLSALLAVVASSLCACTMLDAATSDPDEGVPCPAAESPDGCGVLGLVNDERAKQGVAALRYDPSLARAAQGHAEDMVARGYFDHVSPDGRRFSDRAAAAGYQGFATGENIAQGQRSAAEVMRAWMNSSGHRRNILSSESNELGVGVHDNTWVQVFGQH